MEFFDIEIVIRVHPIQMANLYTMTFYGDTKVVTCIDDVLRFCRNHGYSVSFADLYKPNVTDFEIGDIQINIQRNV